VFAFLDKCVRISAGYEISRYFDDSCELFLPFVFNAPLQSDIDTAKFNQVLWCERTWIYGGYHTGKNSENMLSCFDKYLD